MRLTPPPRRQECKSECADGEQLSLDNSCQPCARGTYRAQGEQPACVACPEGTTTLATGSSSVDQCALPVCKPGQSPPADTGKALV